MKRLEYTGSCCSSSLLLLLLLLLLSPSQGPSQMGGGRRRGPSLEFSCEFFNFFQKSMHIIPHHTTQTDSYFEIWHCYFGFGIIYLTWSVTCIMQYACSL